jgi:thiazole/oxazole-forming peptide maturase SagD family component
MGEKEAEYKYQIPAVPNGEGLSFFGDKGIIDIENYGPDVWAVLKQCEGYKTRNEIIKALEEEGHDARLIGQLVDDLISFGALSDSRQLYHWFHKFTNNPAIYFQRLNDQEIEEISAREYQVEKMGQRVLLMAPDDVISEISKSRETTRKFSDEPLNIKQVSEILSAAYSFNITPVPSAGGLYPLKVYTIVRKDCGIPKGYYQFDPVNDSLIMFNDEVDERQLEHAFNSDPTVFDAPVILVVAADMDRHPEKYSNRGYRYTILEAGHVAQNIALSAESLGVGSVEYGGYNDKNIISELQLDDGTLPLTIVGIGNKSREGDPYIDQAKLYENYYLGKNNIITDLNVKTSESLFNFGYYHSVAHYRAVDEKYCQPYLERYGSGVATSMNTSKIRALAEAYERYCSGLVRFDKVSTANDLDEPWLHPDLVKPLDDDQIMSSRLSIFKPSDVIEWVKAERAYSKKPIYVPIDLVFYPISEESIGRRLVTTANSSGVAAHKDETTAIEKAIYELKERDALMRNWLNKEPLPKLNHQLLNHHWKQRINKWDKMSFATDVIDMSDKEACMINVVIRNTKNEYPYFSSGAAASDSYESSINKAFEEAEISLIYALEGHRKKSKLKENVFSPEDHGNFYLDPKNSEYIDWLWQGKTSNNLKLIGTISNIIAKYDPIVIRLSQAGEPLSVIRVISTELLPISFGLDSEYYLHPQSGVSPNNYQTGFAPHFFA